MCPTDSHAPERGDHHDQTPDMQGIVQICAWCLPHTVRFLRPAPALAPGEALEIEWARLGLRIRIVAADGATVREFRISDGICPEHKARLLAESAAPARVQ